MIYNNITIGFAKDETEKIVYIDRLTDGDRGNKYYCPVCNSELRLVVPEGKTKDGKESNITPHFAHYDASKCSNESCIHYFYKIEYFKKGDILPITTNSYKEYVCKEIIQEKSYTTSFGIYRPDLTIITEDNEEIFVEFAFKNKKKEEEYIDIWEELNKVVVSIDLKMILNSTDANSKKFSILYYEGKVVSDDDSVYVDTIAKHKREIQKRIELEKDDNKIENDKKRILNLDWLWKDILKYNVGKLEIYNIIELLGYIDNIYDKSIITELFKKSKCINLRNDICSYVKKTIDDNYKSLTNKFPEENVSSSCEIIQPREIFYRLFGDWEVSFRIDNVKHTFILKPWQINEINIKINRLIDLEKIKTNVDTFISDFNKRYDYHGKLNYLSPSLLMCFSFENHHSYREKINRISFSNFAENIDDFIITNEITSNNILSKLEEHINKYKKPLSCDLIKLFDNMIGEIKEEYKNQKENYYYQISIKTYGLNLKESIKIKLEIVYKYKPFIVHSQTIFLDGSYINDNGEREYLNNYNDLKNIIYTCFNDALQYYSPISDSVFQSLDYIKKYYNKQKEEINFNYNIITENALEILFKHEGDIIKYQIVDNILNKNGLNIVSFEKATQDEILQYFIQTINKIYFNIYDENCFCKLVLLTEKLKLAYESMIEKWSIRCNITKNYISLIKDFKIVDKYFIDPNIDYDIEFMQSTIKSYFSKTIRQIKYGNTGG